MEIFTSVLFWLVVIAVWGYSYVCVKDLVLPAGGLYGVAVKRKGKWQTYLVDARDAEAAVRSLEVPIDGAEEIETVYLGNDESVSAERYAEFIRSRGD